MSRNEVGTEIPENVESIAKEMDLNLKYIYEDGNYGGKYPASNLRGKRKSTRFRNIGSANAYKFKIADNWVYFKSPKYANSPINDQKEIVPRLSYTDSVSVLNMPTDIDLDSKWHLMYGLTQARRSALLGPPQKQESALNPMSEKFLTFFTLANLDSWQQPKCLKNPIRQGDNKLSDDFFNRISSNDKGLWVKPKEVTFNPNHLHLTSSLKKDGSSDSVFFFEEEIMSIAKRSFKRNTYREISFLDISSKDGWSEFDAYLFLPTLRRCVCIEAKLDSDISNTVTLNGKDIEISQITRAMESAYLFTHHPDSKFSEQEWDYDYLFICPKDRYKKESKMDYPHLIPQIQESSSDVLRNEYAKFDLDPNPVKKDLFGTFLSSAHKHIHVLYWDELVKLIHEIDLNYLSNYMNNLKSNRLLYNIVEKRFKLASIQL